MPIEIKHLTEIAQCDQVFALYRKSSNTLGFMPRGAFEESVHSRWLLGAYDEIGILQGYLLYRVSGRNAAIAHLCVKPENRKSGTASKLVQRLIKLTSHLDGIKLRCRRDFIANKMWPKLGFVAKNQTIGRGVDKADLVIWHLDHNQEDLFSSVPVEKTTVVIDSNVFFDIIYPDRRHHKISSTLTEPWIEDVIQLALTPEIHNDIDRSINDDLKRKSKTSTTFYKELRTSNSDMLVIASQIKNLYPSSCSENDESDIRHLAYTIVFGAKFFITRDSFILSKFAEVFERFDVQILKPSQLITRLDWVERENEYQPVRLAGSLHQVHRFDGLRPDQLSLLFKIPSLERQQEFLESLEICLANPHEAYIKVAKDSESTPTALLAAHQISPEHCEVRLLRASKHPLSSTILRHLIMDVLIKASKDKTTIVLITDRYINQTAQEALDEIGFIRDGASWVKPIMRGFLKQDQIFKTSEHDFVSKLLAECKAKDQTESLIWPGKLDDESIPCYLVPIRAEWAEHFFDTDLASQRIPGLTEIRDDLHLGVEAVYYSSANVELMAPGRIIWYVSKGCEDLGSMQVKACSRLREVVRDKPKELFRRFRRLGVYKWKDVYESAGNSIESRLLALRFSHTERFKFSLDIKTLIELGIRPPYMSPRKIPNFAFKSIYQYAFTGSL